MFSAQAAHALDLGDLVVQSVPGEALRATIPLTLLDNESLLSVRAEVASAEVYQQEGLQRDASLQDIRLELLSTGKGKADIQVFGAEPWQGNEAIMLLQVQWPGGEMSRRYQVSAVNNARADEPPQYVEVAKDESLADIAIRLSKQSNRSYLYMMVALYRANPDAFYRNNLNNLKSGARLRVPTTKELFSLSEAEVTETLRAHQNPAKKPAKPPLKKLENQLKEVGKRNTDLEEHNQQLKDRLGQLEQQLDSMSQEVLDYTKRKQELLESVTEAKKQAEPVVEKEEVKKKNVMSDTGLSLQQMFILLAVVLLAIAILRYFAPQHEAEKE